MFKKLLKLLPSSNDKQIVKAYMDGYEKGKRAGYLEYVQTNITPNNIRAAFGFNPIEKHDNPSSNSA